MGGFLAALLTAAFAVATSAFVQPTPGSVALDSFLVKTAGLTTAERSKLLAGEPVTKLLESEADKEVAVFGGIWINASPAEYVRQVTDIEHLESGEAFRVTKKISDPPKLEDFASLELTDEDFEDLKDCRVGDCELKVSASGLQMLRAQVDWKKPTAKADATAVVRRLALEYVNGYREGGNERLAVYRDKDRPRFVATEFRTMIDRMLPLASHLPDVKRFLLEYPRATLADSSSFLYWQETQFGLKPTIRISHVVVQQRPAQTIVASKMLYASHYFWTALELRILLPEPVRGPGFWFITVSRSRSDGLGGFIGRIVRGRVRDEAKSGTVAALLATKATLEGSSR